MKKLIIFISACLFMLVSCEPDPVISVSRTAFTFDPFGGDKNVQVSANNDWNIMTDADKSFFTVSPMAGTGDGYFVLHVEPNYSRSSRSAQILVICSNRYTSETCIITVFQDGADFEMGETVNRQKQLRHN